MDKQEWLNSLKVGDVVAADIGYHEKFWVTGTIIKKLKRNVTIRINKDNESTVSLESLSEVTADIKVIISKRRLKNYIKENISNLDNMALDNLRIISDLLKGASK